MYTIYQIRNKLNGKIYIGSTKDPKRRKRTHLNLLRKNKHHSRHLQFSFNLYGEENFEFSVLQEIDRAIEALEVEREMIANFKPEYNVMQDVFSHIGLKRSKETCEKISKALVGKKVSSETREKLRQATLGKKQSPELVKKRMRSSYEPIAAFLLDGTLFREFQSATHAAKELGVGRNSIYRVLRGERKTFKNLKWKKL